MALRWLEAIQGCQNIAIFGRLYTNTAGGVGVSYTDMFGRTQFDSSDLTLRTPSLVGSVENTWIIGFGFQIRSGSMGAAPSAFPHVGLRNSAGDQIRLEMVDASDTKPGGSYYKLRVMRGATELARTVERFSGALIDTRRTYFEFKVVVRTGTNGSFSLRYHTHKDGTGFSTATWSAANTGINTANQGTDGADRLTISWTSGNATNRMAFTDLYVCDNTGAKNNDFLGVLYMEALDPASNGNELDWVLAGSATTIEDALNEGATVQSVAEDDKRITSDTVGDISLVAMSNLSAAILTTTIVGMQVRLYGQMDTTGSRDVQFFYRKTTGTPAQVGTAILDLDSTMLVGEADIQENDPNTATNWVIADINGIELGVELDA
jgi:hypothetical protein